jgi:transposase
MTREQEDAQPRDLNEALHVISTLQEQVKDSQREIASLRHQLDVLCRRLFGKKSEKVDPSQLKLAFELLGKTNEDASEPEEADSGENNKPERRRSRRRRRRLAKELPRRRVVLEVAQEQRFCCGVEKTQIGEDISEKLEYIPASLVVVQTVRPKLACRVCHKGVSQAPVPVQAVEKSLAGEGMLAHVVVSKYCDHIPLHRQAGILEREGVELSRATLCGWVGSVADALSPIVEQMKREILASGYLQTDDTPVTVLRPGQAGSYKGRLWAYLDPLERQVVFDASATHERDGPEAFLATFEGYMQADAYVGYDALYQSGHIVEVGCWTHGRRRFVDALSTDTQAASILAVIQQLYQVEHEAAELSATQRREVRQEKSVPLLERIDELRGALQKTVLPKSPLGNALRYIDNQWVALNRFVEDGRLAIDNNGAENQLRAVALGRNNWLFAGSLQGAERAAVLYSLVQSCRLAKFDPFAYFRDVLLRVATHPQSRIHELTPRRWAELFADQAVA